MQDFNKYGQFDSENNYLKINEILNIFRRRKKLFFAVSSLILLINFIDLAYKRNFQPVFKGSFKMLITDPFLDDKKQVMSESSLYESLASGDDGLDIPTLIEFMRSPVLLTELAKKNNLNPRTLSKRISIKKAGETKRFRKDRPRGVLNIYLYSNNPKKGLKLLKELSNTYLSESLKQRQKKIAAGLDFLNKQEPILQEKTNFYQSKLVEFRQKNKLIQPLLEGESIKENERDLQKRKFELDVENSKLNKIKKELLAGNISSKGFTDSISFLAGKGEGLNISNSEKELLNQLLNTENQLAQARSKYREDSKVIKNLEIKIEKIKPNLLKKQIEAVDLAINLISENRKNMIARLETIQKMFLEQPGLIKEYNSLEQNLTLAKKNLVGLTSARENFQLKMAQTNVQWKIIDVPRFSRKPILPNVRRGLIVGFLASFMFGISAVIIRELFNNYFNNEDEISKKLKIPILGVIPFLDIKEKSNQGISFYQSYKDLNTKSKYQNYLRFVIQESVRSILSSINLLSSDKTIKSVAVTSSIPSEGKSSVSSLLALNSSELGKRVLLIDCDLRKPNVHNLLNLDNIRGLSNFISDGKLKIEDVIQTVDGLENFYVVTSGIKPPDPQRLLSSKRFQNLIKELNESQKYDQIILDCPPLMGISDSLIISKFADGMIFIVTNNYVRKDIVFKAIEKIDSSNNKLLGIINNNLKRINEKGAIYGSYGSYGSYGNNYGYAYSSYSETNYSSNDIDTDESDAKLQENFIKESKLYKSIRDLLFKISKYIDN